MWIVCNNRNKKDILTECNAIDDLFVMDRATESMIARAHTIALNLYHNQLHSHDWPSPPAILDFFSLFLQRTEKLQCVKYSMFVWYKKAADYVCHCGWDVPSLYVRKSGLGPFQLLHYLERANVQRLNGATSQPYVKMNLSIESRHRRSINGSVFAVSEGGTERERNRNIWAAKSSDKDVK